MSNSLRETVTHGDDAVEILIEVDEPNTAPWTPYEYDAMRGGQPDAQLGAFKKGMRLIRAAHRRAVAANEPFLIPSARVCESHEVDAGVKKAWTRAFLGVLIERMRVSKISDAVPHARNERLRIAHGLCDREEQIPG